MLVEALCNHAAVGIRQLCKWELWRAAVFWAVGNLSSVRENR